MTTWLKMNIKIICTLCICYTAFVKVQKNVGIIEGNTLNICWFPSFRKVEYLKCKILCTHFDSWQIDCVDFTNRGIILATDIIFDKSCRSYSGTIISTWAIIKGPGESWWHGCNWKKQVKSILWVIMALIWTVMTLPQKLICSFLRQFFI